MGYKQVTNHHPNVTLKNTYIMNTEEIDILTEALYKEWCLTHDPYEDDFEGLLYDLLPKYKFGWANGSYFVLQKFD